MSQVEGLEAKRVHQRARMIFVGACSQWRQESFQSSQSNHWRDLVSLLIDVQILSRYPSCSRGDSRAIHQTFTS